MQFVCARVGIPFLVREILGGERASETLRHQGIEPGCILCLEGVTQVQSLHLGVRTPVVISTVEGLRLFLDHHDARQVVVRPASTGA